MHDATKLLVVVVIMSNCISKRIQYDTFHTHNISTISQIYSSGGCQRSPVAHRADNRYFNNDTAVEEQGIILVNCSISQIWYKTPMVRPKYHSVTQQSCKIPAKSQALSWLLMVNSLTVLSKFGQQLVAAATGVCRQNCIWCDSTVVRWWSRR